MKTKEFVMSLSPSTIGAWLNLKESGFGSEREWLDYVNCKPKEATLQMERGTEFNNTIDVVLSDSDVYFLHDRMSSSRVYTTKSGFNVEFLSSQIIDIAKRIGKHALQQAWLEGFLDLRGGMKVELHGFADYVTLLGEIIELKCVGDTLPSRYWQLGAQHLVYSYLYCQMFHVKQCEFTYLLAQQGTGAKLNKDNCLILEETRIIFSWRAEAELRQICGQIWLWANKNKDKICEDNKLRFKVK